MLYGLVLAGGKSKRMGTDKGAIIYHQLPQREHMAAILSQCCDQTFISIRSDQIIESAYPSVVEWESEGPLSGILSAFQHNHKTAWLITACDMPYLDLESLQYLIKNRNKTAIATAFHHEMLEPLVCIYEKEAYPLLLDFYEKGGRSPKQFLEKVATQAVPIPDAHKLQNINYP